jgi:predicted ArsR family transcriptional regulator
MQIVDLVAALPGTPDPVGGLIETLPKTRRDILSALKLRGEATADELAASLDLSYSSVRKQLDGLEERGFVVHRRVHSGSLGRPRHAYALTALGQELFPRVQVPLLERLVAWVHENVPGAIEAFAATLPLGPVPANGTRVDGWREAVDGVASELSAAGFLASVDVIDDGYGSAALTVSCPIKELAARWPAFCSGEQRAIERALPGTTVRRIGHLGSGDSVCAYALKRGRAQARIDRLSA